MRLNYPCPPKSCIWPLATHIFWILSSIWSLFQISSKPTNSTITLFFLRVSTYAYLSYSLLCFLLPSSSLSSKYKWGYYFISLTRSPSWVWSPALSHKYFWRGEFIRFWSNVWSSLSGAYSRTRSCRILVKNPVGQGKWNRCGCWRYRCVCLGWVRPIQRPPKVTKKASFSGGDGRSTLPWLRFLRRLSDSR